MAEFATSLLSSLTCHATTPEPKSRTNTLSNQTNTFQQLLETMASVRSMGACGAASPRISVPRIVVIGSQSSGKSSVINAIVGTDGAIPTGSCMTTRVPMEIHLSSTASCGDDGAHNERDAHTTIDIGRYRHGNWESALKDPPTLPLSSLDATHVSSAITKLSDELTDDNAHTVSSESICARVQGPACPDLVLVDTPGLVSVGRTDLGQPTDLPDHIRAIADNLIEGSSHAEDTLLLLVMCARPDLETDPVWCIAKRHDPHGERTCVVLTKPDHVDRSNADEVLRFLSSACPSSLQAQLGYHLVYLKHGLSGEPDFFKQCTHFSRRTPTTRIGSCMVANTLTSIVESRLRQNMPHMLDWIQAEMRTLKQLDVASETPSSLKSRDVASSISIRLHNDVFRYGSSVGRQIRETLEGTTHELETADEVTSELRHDLSGIHMSSCSSEAMLIEGFMRNSRDALRSSLLSQHDQCVDAIATALVQCAQQIIGTMYPGHSSLTLFVTHTMRDLLSRQRRLSYDSFDQALSAELRYCWIHPQLKRSIGEEIVNNVHAFANAETSLLLHLMCKCIMHHVVCGSMENLHHAMVDAQDAPDAFHIDDGMEDERRIKSAYRDQLQKVHAALMLHCRV